MHNRLLVAAGAAALLAWAAPASAQRQVNTRQPASGSGTMEIHTHGGSLRVIGWNRNEIQVTGTLSRDGDRLQMEDGDVMVVGSRGRAGPSTLEVRVPAGKSVDVQTNGGMLSISGVDGNIEAVNAGGPVTVEGTPRNVEISTTNGPVTVNATTRDLEVHSMNGAISISGTVRGRLEADAMNGGVTVNAAAERTEINTLNGAVRVTNANGPVDVNTVSGAIQVSGRRISGNYQTVAGAMVLEGGLGGELNVESHSGSVELRVPGGTDADVTITTWNGRFASDFGDGRRDGGERRLRLGSGGPDVSITTFSGPVRITRR
ncbi:MAG TPA: DUF4097 family beta strand repeat-containing protein [Longimicrobium sp.]|jgi:DUF4097 and DUF4098 domain-containing protein YvlB|uniref:DUF4097 family beta strand repeat-containing protein n=1 Tax=Longimicrobium sp. TaxID=2029185 RepID=UPI002EDA5973